jgi:hypothetical protein
MMQSCFRNAAYVEPSGTDRTAGLIVALRLLY